MLLKVPHVNNDTNFSAKGFDKIFSHMFKIALDTLSRCLYINKTSFEKKY